MQSKGYSREDIVFNYFFAEGKERDHYKTGSNIYFEGNILYSYGTHFPLAVKCKNGYILNGDTYSRETGKHQRTTRDWADNQWFFMTHIKSIRKLLEEMIDEYNKRQKAENPHWDEKRHSISMNDVRNAIVTLKHDHGYRGWDIKIHKNNPVPKDTCPICQAMPEGHNPIHHCIIPFSSFRGPGLIPRELTILDVTKDTHETVKRTVKNKETGKKEIREVDIHHLGASLVRYKHRRFLSSIDNSSKRYQYFLVELQSRRINNVEDAFRDLGKNLNDEQWERYQVGEIKRQGEYFLEPHPDITTRELKKKAKAHKIKRRVPNIISLVPKTPRWKNSVKEATRRFRSTGSHEEGVDPDCIKVMQFDDVKYYVQINADYPNMTIPENATLQNGVLFTVEHPQLLNQFDLSGGDGNPHTARDFIKTPDGNFIRGTLRHDEHKMVKMGNTWHQVFINTARGSWSAVGNVD